MLGRTRIVTSFGAAGDEERSKLGPSARLFARKEGLSGGGTEGCSQEPAPLFLGGKVPNGAGTLTIWNQPVKN